MTCAVQVCGASVWCGVNERGGGGVHEDRQDKRREGKTRQEKSPCGNEIEGKKERGTKGSEAKQREAKGREGRNLTYRIHQMVLEIS